MRLDDAASESHTSGSCYSKKTVLCSVAHALPAPPAIDPKQSTDSLLVVDAKAEPESFLFLGRKVDLGDPSFPSLFEDRWSQRPFPYSSAINQKAAEIIMDGSGTFLALALQRGMQVKAQDVRPRCTDGTRQNLVHLFG